MQCCTIAAILRSTESVKTPSQNCTLTVRVKLHNNVDQHPSPQPHLLAISNRTWPRSPERTGSGCLCQRKVMCCGHLSQAINSLPWRHWHNYHCARHRFRCGEDKVIRRKHSNNITAMRVLRKALGSREQSNTSAFVRDRTHIPMAEACDSSRGYITKYIYTGILQYMWLVASLTGYYRSEVFDMPPTSVRFYICFLIYRVIRRWFINLLSFMLCWSSHVKLCLPLILRRSRTGTVWFYTSTSNKRAARPKLYTKSLTGDLKRMYSRFTLVRISINL